MIGEEAIAGTIVGVRMVIAGGAVSVAPAEAQAQSYRAERAIARDIPRARAHRAYRADRTYHRGY